MEFDLKRSQRICDAVNLLEVVIAETFSNETSQPARKILQHIGAKHSKYLNAYDCAVSDVNKLLYDLGIPDVVRDETNISKETTSEMIVRIVMERLISHEQ